MSQGVETRVEKTTEISRQRKQHEQSHGGQETGCEVYAWRPLGVPGIWVETGTGRKQTGKKQQAAAPAVLKSLNLTLLVTVSHRKVLSTQVPWADFCLMEISLSPREISIKQNLN